MLQLEYTHRYLQSKKPLSGVSTFMGASNVVQLEWISVLSNRMLLKQIPYFITCSVSTQRCRGDILKYRVMICARYNMSGSRQPEGKLPGNSSWVTTQSLPLVMILINYSTWHIRRLATYVMCLFILPSKANSPQKIYLVLFKFKKKRHR